FNDSRCASAFVWESCAGRPETWTRDLARKLVRATGLAIGGAAFFLSPSRVLPGSGFRQISTARLNAPFLFLLLVFDQDSALDPIESREFSLQVSVAFVKKCVLFPRPNAAARRFAVLRKQRVGDFHPFDDFSDGHERFLVVSRGIVLQIDEQLRRAPIGC